MVHADDVENDSNASCGGIRVKDRLSRKLDGFLSKFSRECFNAETLVTDAENSNYRRAMVDKLAATLNNPADNEEFVKWLIASIYKGRRLNTVLARLKDLLRQAMEATRMRSRLP